MKRMSVVFIAIASLSLLIGCQPKIDVKKEKAEILELLEMHKKALLESDIEALLSHIPEDHENIMVTRGKIFNHTRAGTKQDFENQFKQGRYVEISNLVTPTINISLDGKTAWGVGQDKYTYSNKDSTGVEHEYVVINAWLSVWEKNNDKWVEKALAQTFENE